MMSDTRYSKNPKQIIRIIQNRQYKDSDDSEYK